MTRHLCGCTLGLVLVLAAASSTAVPPAQSKDKELATQPGKATQIVIIGTIHEGHFRSSWYSPEVLRAIILALEPQAILNELPLAQVEADGRPIASIRPYSVSPECWAVDQAAQQLGVEQIPFDMPDRNEYFARTRYFEREEKAQKQLQEWGRLLYKQDPEHAVIKVAGLFNQVGVMQGALNTQGMPESVNSVAFDAAIRLKHSIVYNILPRMMDATPDMKDAAEAYRRFGQEWQERNAIMSQNILRAVAKFPAGRLVVITGCEHRYMLRELLAGQKQVDLKEYWELVSLDPRQVPQSQEGRAHRASQRKATSQPSNMAASSQAAARRRD